jgi:hypothetical protein
MTTTLEATKRVIATGAVMAALAVALLAGLHSSPQTAEAAPVCDAKCINDAAAAKAQKCADEKGKSSWDGTIIFCLGGNAGDWACDVATGLCACKGANGKWEKCLKGPDRPPHFDDVAPPPGGGIIVDPDEPPAGGGDWTNAPPRAKADAYRVAEGRVLRRDEAKGLLANDAAGCSGRCPRILVELSVRLVAGPANGELTLNPDGSFIYQPERNFDGTDRFTYELSDGRGGTATARVTIKVAARPN